MYLSHRQNKSKCLYMVENSTKSNFVLNNPLVLNESRILTKSIKVENDPNVPTGAQEFKD